MGGGKIWSLDYTDIQGRWGYLAIIYFKLSKYFPTFVVHDT